MTQNLRRVRNIIKKHISCKFYIRASVHRDSRLNKSNEMQQYADIYLLLNYSTCFGRPSRPSSGVHKTVVAASGTDMLSGEQACSPDSTIRILSHLVGFQQHTFYVEPGAAT